MKRYIILVGVCFSAALALSIVAEAKKAGSANFSSESRVPASPMKDSGIGEQPLGNIASTCCPTCLKSLRNPCGLEKGDVGTDSISTGKGGNRSGTAIHKP